MEETLNAANSKASVEKKRASRNCSYLLLKHDYKKARYPRFLKSEPKCMERSSLVTHSVSSSEVSSSMVSSSVVSSSMVSSTPMECIPIIPEVLPKVRDLSEITRLYNGYPWAPFGTPGASLAGNCLAYINAGLKVILLRLHGRKKYISIWKERSDMEKRLVEDDYTPMHYIISKYIKTSNIPRELRPSIVVLYNMHRTKNKIKKWKVSEWFHKILCTCDDYDLIKEKLWFLEDILKRLRNNFYEFISVTNGISGKRLVETVGVTLYVYRSYVDDILARGTRMLIRSDLRCKSNIYGDSGRFVYQFMADSLENLCSVHPCNLENIGVPPM